MLNLNREKVIYPGQHNSSYSIFYEFRNAGSKKFPKFSEWKSKNCYGSFFSQMSAVKDVKKLFTTFKIVPTSVKLSKEDVIAWVNLCKENKMLPKYIVTKDCFKTGKNGNVSRGFLNINLDMDMSHSLLYVYLDTFRKLREDPGFVKSVLYLCNEKKVDFFIAFVLSSHFNITSTGHHSILVDKSPYSSVNKPNPKGVFDELNLKMVRSLYKFINEDGAKKGGLLGKVGHWRCNGFIAEITKTDLVVPIKSLNTKKVINIVREVDCKKAEALYNKLKK
jgi:hypothetical protein